jgi:hypothetical protein
MKYLFTLSLLSALSICSLEAQTTFSREARDQIWLFGYDSFWGLPFGASILDFSTEPPTISYDSLVIDFEMTNASICSAEGALELYTNGLYIADASHDTIQNGSGLNPDPYTDIWINYGYYSMIQSTLFLPTDDQEKYLLLHSEKERTEEPDEYNSEIRVKRLYKTEVVKNDSGAFEVSEKNIPVLFDTIGFGQLTACRHANGRDWWVLAPEYFSDIYNRLLIQGDSVRVLEKKTMPHIFQPGTGQSCFSPDGSKYIRYNLVYWGQDQYLEIYDFDRCTGELYNPNYITIVDSAWFAGAAISENSRFLYLSSHLRVYQYDLEADDIKASKEVVALYDGFSSPLSTRFFLAQLAPNGKIYISTPATTDRLHVIDHPNLKGELCEFKQHEITLPAYNWRTMPNHPYYGLGPDDGSLCDTLDIDNPPPKVAFDYVITDSMAFSVDFYDNSMFSPTDWYWEFGDGNSSIERFPTHIYANGSYEVCLTVSNAIGNNTLCKEIALGVSNTVKETSNEIAYKLWPNPASEFLNISTSQPFSLSIARLHDINGREVEAMKLPDQQKTFTFSTHHLTKGIYFLTIQNGLGEIWRERVVVY